MNTGTRSHNHQMITLALFSHFTNRSNNSLVFTTDSLKYVIKPISAVFHLLTICKHNDIINYIIHHHITLVKVVEPEAISICLTLLWKRCCDSSSTLRKH